MSFCKQSEALKSKESLTGGVVGRPLDPNNVILGHVLHTHRCARVEQQVVVTVEHGEVFETAEVGVFEAASLVNLVFFVGQPSIVDARGAGVDTHVSVHRHRHNANAVPERIAEGELLGLELKIVAQNVDPQREGLELNLEGEVGRAQIENLSAADEGSQLLGEGQDILTFL